MPFGKNFVDKFNPKSSFPTKMWYNKFDLVFDPSKDIMLVTKG